MPFRFYIPAGAMCHNVVDKCRDWDRYTGSHDQNIKQIRPKCSVIDLGCFLRFSTTRSNTTRTGSRLFRGCLHTDSHD